MLKGRKYRYLVLLLPFLAVAVLYEVLPLCMMVIDSFMPDEGAASFTLTNYYTVFTKLLYQKAITNSFKISMISSVAGIVIAFWGARAIHQLQGKLGHIFMVILNMVSNFAGVPLALAYMILLGNTGVVVQIGRQLGWDLLADYELYTSNGISMIYVYFQIPLATLLLIPAFEGIRKEWKEAAALLGASAGRFWMKVGIPVLMPSILGTFGVLFANALAAYATVYALMMNSISLLPVQIAGCFVGEVTIRKGLGGALSVVMMLIMVLMIYVTNRLSRVFQKGEVKA